MSYGSPTTPEGQMIDTPPAADVSSATAQPSAARRPAHTSVARYAEPNLGLSLLGIATSRP
jgi:hypothetical protein